MGLSKLLNRFSRSDKDRSSDFSTHGQGSCIGDKGKLCQCRILFLDDTDLCLDVKTGAKGHQLLNRVFDHLDLLEKDYFGLRYLDETTQTHWLDPAKSIGSQLKTLPPHTLYFGVKFYAADPCKLREELTRYQFFLQVKRDILQGRLPVQFDLSAELAAYAVQSELGDYDAKRHNQDYVSEFRFVPCQTEELETRVAHIHQSIRGIVPAIAEYRYLEKSKWLDMYGVDLHPVQGEGNLEYFLGLTPTGIVVFRNKQKVGNYFWPRLNKVTFKGKMFMIRVKDRNKEENTYAFECSTKPACKHLWKCCIEHHAFFRLTSSNESYSATGRFLIFGSKHRYSGRTEKQAQADGTNRPPPKVVRTPSKRHQRRSSADSLPNGYLRNYEADNMIVMAPHSEPQGRDRGYSSAPESPRSHRSPPWDTRQNRGGLFTSGRASPGSEYSERMLFPPGQPRRRDCESESEGGPKRRAHRSRIDPSDSEAEYKSRHFVTRVPAEYTDASESEAEYRKHRKYRKSHENVAPHEMAWAEQQRRIRDGGFQGPFQLRPNGSLTSVASGESAHSRRRRRRSKSPGNRKPPEELAEHFKYVDPSAEGIPDEQLRDIAYTAVDTGTDPSLKAKAHRRLSRSKSPKNKHNENAERFAAAAARVASSAPSSLVNGPTTTAAVSQQRPPDVIADQPPPPYSESPGTRHRSPAKATASSAGGGAAGSQGMLHPPIQPTYGAARTLTSSGYAQPQHYSNNSHQYIQSSPYRIPEPAEFKSPVRLQRVDAVPSVATARNSYTKSYSSSTVVAGYQQQPSLYGQHAMTSQSLQQQNSMGKLHAEHAREDSGVGIESNPSRSPCASHRSPYHSSTYPSSPYQSKYSSQSYQQHHPHYYHSAQGSPASYNNQPHSLQPSLTSSLHTQQPPSASQYHYTEQATYKSGNHHGFSSHSHSQPRAADGYHGYSSLGGHHGNQQSAYSSSSLQHHHHMTTANTRRIYSTNQHATDNYHAPTSSSSSPYRAVGASVTQSEKTTDL